MKRASGIILFVILSTVVFCFANDENLDEARERMVLRQIILRGVRDKRVIEAMKKVPRHLFVPSNIRDSAYQDRPLPIGYNQTISQPYIVAYMTEALNLDEGDRVLEIGTGSGYQAAVLAEIVKEVYTIEILSPLAEQSKERLAKLGYDNITVKCGDGYLGWEEKAPFDAIIVTAAPEKIPQKLVKQLEIGGQMVIPVGEYYQELYLIRKTKDGIKEKRLIPVRFVPMVHGE